MASERTKPDGRASDIFQPSTLLPSQYRDQRGENLGISPERRLLVAVLEIAIADLTKANWRDDDARDVARAAWNWIHGVPVMRRSDDPRLSFAELCGELGLDPAAVREALLRRVPSVPARLEPKLGSNRQQSSRREAVFAWIAAQTQLWTVATMRTALGLGEDYAYQLAREGHRQGVCRRVQFGRYETLRALNGNAA